MPTYDQIIARLIPEVEYHQNRYARTLDEVITRGVRWLDLGAGTRPHWGWLGASIQAQVSRSRFMVGCDLALDHLAQNAYLTGAVGGDAANLPFAAESFDVVSANMVVEHLPNPEATFREIRRVLAPGGRFVFLTSHLGHPAVRLAALLLPPPVRRLLSVRAEGRNPEHVFLTYYRANTPRRLRQLADAVGFHPAELDVFPSYPFIRRPAAAVALECMAIRTLRWKPLRLRFSSNLIGVLQKA